MKNIALIGLALVAGNMAMEGAKMRVPSEKTTQAMESGPRIRVLLENEAASALLEVKGEYRVVRNDSGATLSSGSIGKRFVVHPLKEGIRWGEEYLDIFRITLVPESPATTMFVNGIQYKGRISIYQTKNDRLAIVNDVSIEDFIKATVPPQIDSRLSKEAMAALAITVRTDAYHKAATQLTPNCPWDVIAGEIGYEGYGVTLRDFAFEESVDGTRHMVMQDTRSPKNEGGAFAADWTKGELARASGKLSLVGAEELARRGYDAGKILQSFFPNSKVSVAEPVKRTNIR